MTVVNSNKSVAAIVVTYRSEVWIKKCLESVLNQPEITSIWVVDNASDDGTTALIQQQFPQVNLIENTDNLGFAAANNLALQAMSEPYALLVNPDAYVESGCVKHLLNAFDAENHVGIAAPRIMRDGDIEASLSGKPSALASCLFLLSGMRNFETGGFSGKPVQGYPWHDGAQGEHVRGSCLMVSQAAIADAGLFDERFFLYFEETEWCLRLRKHGWNIVLNPQAVAYHIGRASMKTESALPSLEFMRGAVLFWQVYYCSVVSVGLRITLFMMAGLKWSILTMSGAEVARRDWLKDVMSLARNPFKLGIIYPKAKRPRFWDL